MTQHKQCLVRGCSLELEITRLHQQLSMHTRRMAGCKACAPARTAQ